MHLNIFYPNISLSPSTPTHLSVHTFTRPRQRLTLHTLLRIPILPLIIPTNVILKIIYNSLKYASKSHSPPNNAAGLPQVVGSGVLLKKYQYKNSCGVPGKMFKGVGFEKKMAKSDIPK
jgi:hypothetical protein